MSLFSKARSLPLARKTMLALISLLSAVNQMVPKDDKRILFYESHDGGPSDNSEAMCHWMVKGGLSERYAITYCANSLGLLADSPVKRVNRIRGISEYLRSKYVFYSFGGMRIKPSKNQIVVNLWHGAPLKSIGKFTHDEAYLRESLDDFTYLVSPSELFSDVFTKAFGCDGDKILVVGYPRCDYLHCGKLLLEEFGLRVSDNALRRILWMPTFRRSSDGRFSQDYHCSETGLPLLETGEALRAANEVLEKMGCILVVKAHHNALIESKELSNIVFCSNGDIESSGHRLYEFVAQFDALLTDYSSICFDFMQLDRPIAFTVDDFDEYAEKRGFSVEDPLSLMPGDHITDLEGLYGFFKSVALGTDTYAAERRCLAARFEGSSDRCNSGRLAYLLGIE